MIERELVATQSAHPLVGAVAVRKLLAIAGRMQHTRADTLALDLNLPAPGGKREGVPQVGGLSPTAIDPSKSRAPM